MKSKYTSFVSLLLSILIIPMIGEAQDGHWVYKEMISGNHFGSTLSPDRIEVDVNGGVVEFSLRQANNCTERFRLTYRFLQDMDILEIPENSNSLPVYPYEVEFESLDSPCYLNQGYSNPFVNITHAGASSGVMGNMKKNKTWKYKYYQDWLSNHKWYSETGLGGENRHYARKNGNSHTGKVRGYYNVKGPHREDVERTVKNSPGMATDFRILIKAQSTISKAESFYYDILFIYELKKGSTGATTEKPCDIQEPDCSCCPGTVPIWNFQTDKGDCICPEGQVWDKIRNKCVITN